LTIKNISRSNPACVVFLLDRSETMGRQTTLDGRTLAEWATDLVNQAIISICIRAASGDTVRHYFDIGVIGYGILPGPQSEGVSSAFEGAAFSDKVIVDLPLIAENPARFKRRQDAPVEVAEPIWIEPAYGLQKPLCQALAVAGMHINDWISKGGPGSIPPVVVNVTDGAEPTDDPYDGATLNEWLERVQQLRTDSGPTKIFNVTVSTESKNPVLRPATVSALTDPGWGIGQVAGLLPDIDINLWASTDIGLAE
jgi:hypothetical protein